jgi:hypothetical protein
MFRKFGSHPAGQTAAPLDQRGQSVAAQATKCCVYGEPAGAPGSFGNPVVIVPSIVRPGHKIRGIPGHRCTMSGLIAHKDDARVLRDIQPFMTVDGNRVGVLNTPDQVPQLRRHRGPEAKRAIHMEPATTLVHDTGDLKQGIECACVHIACLGADDGRCAKAGKRAAQLIRSHPPLLVRLDLNHSIAPQTQQLQRPKN